MTGDDDHSSPVDAFFGPFLDRLAEMLGNGADDGWSACLRRARNTAGFDLRDAPGELVAAVAQADERVDGLDASWVPPATGEAFHLGGPADVATALLEGLRPVFESLVVRLRDRAGSHHPSLDTDPDTMLMGRMLPRMAPALVGMSLGSAAGRAARDMASNASIPVPAAAGQGVIFSAAAHSDPQHSPALVTHDVVLHRLCAVPAVRDRLERSLLDHAEGWSPDLVRLGGRFADVELVSMGALRSLIGWLDDPTFLFGDGPTCDQETARAEIAVATTALTGIAERVTTLLTGGRAHPTPNRDRGLGPLTGVPNDPDTAELGHHFVTGVVERAGDAALGSLWRRVDGLPTGAELSAPGLWLERLELGD
jgi:hypothetical protein